MTICQCQFDLFTGFEDVRFAIRADDRSGVYTDWSGMEPIYAEEQIPYSNQIVRELIGFTPATVTWRLELPCKHQYDALLARLGTLGTLTVLANFQTLRGEQTSYGNPPRVYEVLDDVLLRAIPNREFHPDGFVEIDATFSRAFDPETRLAASEDE